MYYDGVGRGMAVGVGLGHECSGSAPRSRAARKKAIVIEASGTEAAGARFVA
jgi:hypothetical protein